MQSIRTKLLMAREKTGLPWEVVERDYLLSWILYGISQNSLLYQTLIFKGGTALKKCYFGEYRFSEDLDFTGINNVPTGHAMQKAIKEACEQASAQLNFYAPIEIICKPHLEQNPHPRGQEAFDIYSRFSWHRQPQVHIMVEITIDEPLLKPAIPRAILHEYEESINGQIMTYQLEEIIAEKLRSILQHLQTLERRGWARSRARDYYDLWRIFDTYQDQLNFSEFKILLQKKCQVRDVSFLDHNSFFHPTLLSTIEKTWEQWLAPLVPNLPPYEIVINELRLSINKYLF